MPAAVCKSTNYRITVSFSVLHLTWHMSCFGLPNRSPIGGHYPVVGCAMSRSVLGQPISKRQRGSFGEASLLLGHLIDSASRAAADRPVTPPPKPERRRRGISSRVCGVCERIFSSRSAVRRHLVTHTGHRPFSCTVCGRRFSLKGNLMAHYLTHSGAKPFECHLCPQVFSQRCSLNRHLRRTHGTGAK
ncbi:hypothetical protein MRX96_014414 [Rhipicephalus microplus]